MTRSARSASILFAATSFLLIFALAGCGEMTTAPESAGGSEVQNPSGGPMVLQVGADGNAHWVAMPDAFLAPTPIQYGDATFDPARALTVSNRIDGSVGGRLVCGRFVASVPAGAFDGVGTITMSMPDSTIMLCDLNVEPVELNGFLKPIDLALHTTGTTTDLDSLEIYWWDPDARSWKAMGCQKSTNLERVLLDELLTADAIEGAVLPLAHFSRYAAGKAGW